LDLDRFHARELPCSRVESRNDPISGRRGDSGVPYSFTYRDLYSKRDPAALANISQIRTALNAVGRLPFSPQLTSFPCQQKSRWV